MKEKTLKTSIFKDQSVKSFSYMVLLLLVFSAPILFFPKENFTFWLNSFHSPFLDRFFYFITYLGDGLVFIPVFILLLFRSYVLSAFFAFFIAFEALIVQLLLKKGIFAHLLRPSAYIENFEELHQVAGVDLHAMHTFPSGHTQSVFLMAFFLALVFRKGTWVNMILIVLAALTALSRVYILQHFFVDIWFGALIGFGIPFLTICILQRSGRFPKSTGYLRFKKG